jgi:creatinine amidohydrolase
MRTTPLLYERLSWPEVREAAELDLVCLIPVATLEDHGPHLPIDTDLRITAEICRRAAEAAPQEILLLPPVPHGYSPHHMDFPGPITIAWDTFTRYCRDIGTSLARHGFKRMLFLNGHGSNQNLGAPGCTRPRWSSRGGGVPHVGRGVGAPHRRAARVGPWRHGPCL